MKEDIKKCSRPTRNHNPRVKESQEPPSSRHTFEFNTPESVHRMYGQHSFPHSHDATCYLDESPQTDRQSSTPHRSLSIPQRPRKLFKDSAATWSSYERHQKQQQEGYRYKQIQDDKTHSSKVLPKRECEDSDSAPSKCDDLLPITKEINEYESSEDDDEPEHFPEGQIPRCCNCNNELSRSTPLYECNDGRRRWFCQSCPSPIKRRRNNPRSIRSSRIGFIF